MTLGDFSKQADAYRRARPDYPANFLETLISDAGVNEGDAVADFGAGTGIFTRMLVERRFDVTAIEPNEAMWNRADDLQFVRWLQSTFEESQLPSSSQRWAVAAQAFHWADPVRSLPEIRRILQPDCLFTILWNNRASSESEILTWTENTIRTLVPDFDEAYRNRPWQKILESTGDFHFVHSRKFRHVIRMSPDRYLELWKSHNRLNTIAGPARFESFFTQLKTYLEETQSEQLDIPYYCESWSARRYD